MPPSLPNHVSHLRWSHVAVGLTFVAFNSAISYVLELHLGSSLAIAALRCMVQLTVVAIVLQWVLAVKKPWAVGGIACAFFPTQGFIITCETGADLPYCSASEYTRHIRNRCVVSSTEPGSFSPPTTSAIIKPKRRCRYMVRVSAVRFLQEHTL